MLSSWKESLIKSYPDVRLKLSNILDLIKGLFPVVSSKFFLFSSRELIKLNPSLPDSEEFTVP